MREPILLRKTFSFYFVPCFCFSLIESVPCLDKRSRLTKQSCWHKKMGSGTRGWWGMRVLEHSTSNTGVMCTLYPEISVRGQVRALPLLCSPSAHSHFLITKESSSKVPSFPRSLRFTLPDLDVFAKPGAFHLLTQAEKGKKRRNRLRATLS